jgi:hypothetical protein
MASGAFNIAVTGMQAQSKNLEVIANNIANSQTTAFKANKITFQEVYVSHSGVYANGTHNQFGNGVTSAGVTTDWGTGSIASTGTSSNVAITADGMFLVFYNSSVYYTRAGDFTLCKNPYYDSSYAPGGVNNPGTVDPVSGKTIYITDDMRGTEYVFMNSNGAVLMADRESHRQAVANVNCDFTTKTTPTGFGRRLHQGGHQLLGRAVLLHDLLQWNAHLRAKRHRLVSKPTWRFSASTTPTPWSVSTAASTSRPPTRPTNRRRHHLVPRPSRPKRIRHDPPRFARGVERRPRHRVHQHDHGPEVLPGELEGHHDAKRPLPDRPPNGSVARLI